jgi:hypothetical protein
VSHPQMMYYLAKAEMDEAHRVARRSRHADGTAPRFRAARRRADRALEAQVGPDGENEIEEDDRVPSLV